MAIVMFALSFSTSKIFAVEIIMTLTFTFRMDQYKFRYDNRMLICEFLFVTAAIAMFVLSLFQGYSQSKWVWRWPWPLEWARVNYKYANRKNTHDLLCVQTVCEIIAHPKYSIWNFDFENECQVRWRFGWKWVCELKFSTCLCVSDKIYISRSSHLFPVKIRGVHTLYVQTYAHNLR